MNLEDELTPREIAQMREMAAAIWGVNLDKCWVLKTDYTGVGIPTLSENSLYENTVVCGIHLDHWINGERKVSMGLMPGYKGHPILAFSKCGRLWCDPRPPAHDGTECE